MALEGSPFSTLVGARWLVELALLNSLHLNMNPHLKNLDDDFLYHLGYSKSDGLDVLFGDVKASGFCG